MAGYSVRKIKSCNNGHPEINFYYISEMDKCPLCEALEVANQQDIINTLEDEKEELTDELDSLRDEKEELKDRLIELQDSYEELTEECNALRIEVKIDRR